MMPWTYLFFPIRTTFPIWESESCQVPHGAVWAFLALMKGGGGGGVLLSFWRSSSAQQWKCTQPKISSEFPFFPFPANSHAGALNGILPMLLFYFACKCWRAIYGKRNWIYRKTFLGTCLESVFLPLILLRRFSCSLIPFFRLRLWDTHKGRNAQGWKKGKCKGGKRLNFGKKSFSFQSSIHWMPMPSRGRMREPKKEVTMKQKSLQN